jgi:Flp pilus assembly protein TadG
MTKLRQIDENSGQSLLEMALMFPLLIMLFLGAAEYGRLAYIGIEVTNAARAGADYGAQNRGTASDSAGITSTATSDGANLKSMGVTPQYLCAASYSAPATTDCTGTPGVEYVQVNTQVTVASLFSTYGFGGNYTLHGQAIERVRQ